MLNKMTERLDFQSEALLLRAERQRAIASNIANADTPGYVARDFNFREALMAATGTGKAAMQASTTTMATKAAAGHIPLQAKTSDDALKAQLGYSVNSQSSLDNNTVDLDRERASFVDNSVRYEATLRFINGQSKTMLSAIQGQ
ncbi:flagellar basal body rod protein FlgB [Comamonas sp. Y33R10-2]|uniref:flagellar basal body rod protein FlgB n=1 Tax=Comamonas sp. Y33R10-2 TaxID=2853257 RepID=UPI001C5CB3D8|nr:flagellar basal body rod protein FlgB [Comamonas sp. Y33R10-2]QXZ09013.1 flagellar basal body rod protein FlgB [Comamonas sp. Y33R10-2]